MIKPYLFAITFFLIITGLSLLFYYFGIVLLGEFGGLLVFIFILLLFKTYDILKKMFNNK